MGKKGSSEIDGIMSLLFFIIITVIFITTANYLSGSGKPYESPMQSHMIDISKTVQDKMTWQISTIPVTFESEYQLENYPLSITYTIPESAINSTYVSDNYGTIYHTGIDKNTSKIYWIADINEGKNEFYIRYIENSYLNISSETTAKDNTIESNTISNAYIHTEYSSSGITSLMFNTIEFVEGTIQMETASSPQITNTTVKATAAYPENITATIFSNSTRILIHSETPKDFEFHLTNYLTEFYIDGTAYDFNGTNTYSGTSDFADLYDENGIAIIGSNLDITINDPSTERTIIIAGATDFEIYLHEGNYMKTINETEIYPSPSIDIGIIETTEGVREDRIDELEGMYYDEFRNQLEIEDIGILVKVEDI